MTSGREPSQRVAGYKVIGTRGDGWPVDCSLLMAVRFDLTHRGTELNVLQAVCLVI